MPSWLLLWATLQAGLVPIANNGTLVQDIAYAEPGFGATLFELVTVEGSIRTYFRADGSSPDGLPQFWPLRDTYSIGARVDPTPWIRIGFLHWCSHPTAPFGKTEWPGDSAATEIYVRLKVEAR